jgi:hypothetical protein
MGSALRKGLLVCVAVIACATGLLAQGTDELIARLLEVTGTSRQLEQGAGLIATLFEQNRNAYDEDTFSSVQAIIKAQFSDMALLEHVNREFRLGFNEAYCLSLLEAYESELFLRITETEVQSQSPAFEAKVNRFSYESVSKARDAIFERFLEDSRFFELSEALATDSLRAFFVTFNIALPDSRKIPESTVTMALDKVRKQVHSKVERLNEKKRLAVMYAGYSDAELESYFGLYSAAEGQWFTELTVKGMSRAFVECMMNAANAIKAKLGMADSKA